MNIALPALVVFALLLPGFIARSRIKRVERQALDYSPFGQIVTEAVSWAFGLHLLGAGLVEWLSPWTVKPDVVLSLIATESAQQRPALESLARMAGPIAAYLAAVTAVAWLAPTALRRVVVRHRLDRAGSPVAGLVRFSGAPWYYLLSGADFDADEAPDCVSISAFVSVAGEPWVYTGILDDYFLQPDGQLDRLVLENVMRRPLSSDKSPASDGDERFYPIDGDYFVLRYAEAITLNVQYLRFTEQ